MNKKVVFLDLFSILTFSQQRKVFWGWESDIRDQLRTLNKNMYDKVKKKIHSKFALRASYIDKDQYVNNITFKILRSLMI